MKKYEYHYDKDGNSIGCFWCDSKPVETTLHSHRRGNPKFNLCNFCYNTKWWSNITEDIGTDRGIKIFIQGLNFLVRKIEEGKK